ncbi:hypothetical protein BDN72DRAFT_743612, partial [Pluteus cervinus]
KVLSLTLDNASPNNVMVSELVKKLKPYFKAYHRLRCFLHVVNLIAHSILAVFD